MSAFEFFAFMGGLLVLLRVLKRLERKLTKHRANYASSAGERTVWVAQDPRDQEVAEFLNVIFANWTVDELASLSGEADHWSRKV